MCDANGSVLPRRGMRKLSALVLPPPNRPSAMGRRRVCGVFAADGAPIGTLLVWVKDGYISALEYAWVTDVPPVHLLTVDQVRLGRP